MHFDKHLVALGFSVLDLELSHLGELQKLPQKRRKQKLKRQKVLFWQDESMYTLALKTSKTMH